MVTFEQGQQRTVGQLVDVPQFLVGPSRWSGWTHKNRCNGSTGKFRSGLFRKVPRTVWKSSQLYHRSETNRQAENHKFDAGQQVWKSRSMFGRKSKENNRGRLEADYCCGQCKVFYRHGGDLAKHRVAREIVLRRLAALPEPPLAAHQSPAAAASFLTLCPWRLVFQVNRCHKHLLQFFQPARNFAVHTHHVDAQLCHPTPSTCADMISRHDIIGQAAHTVFGSFPTTAYTDLTTSFPHCSRFLSSSHAICHCQ